MVTNSYVILNALPIKAGGGVQKTITLLKTFRALGLRTNDYLLIVRRGSVLEEVGQEYGFRVISVHSSLLGRLFFELGARRKFSRGSLCFTLAGPPLLTSQNFLVNLVEVDYSNLLYPEVNFRKGFPFFLRLGKNLIDLYRKTMIRKADFWIFETDVLRHRAISQFGFSKSRTRVVEVAPNCDVYPARIDSCAAHRFDQTIPKGTRFLFLNSPHPNKQVHLCPPLLKELIKQGIHKPIAVTTLPSGHWYTQQVFQAFRDNGLLDNWYNLGRVIPGEVASCMSVIDAVCTLSRIESFSNNFVEAWAMSKLLIASDVDWAIQAAKDAALLVRITDPKSAGIRIAHVMQDERRLSEFIGAGHRKLRNLPNASEKLRNYLKAIQAASDCGRASSGERKQIKW